MSRQAGPRSAHRPWICAPAAKHDGGILHRGPALVVTVTHESPGRPSGAPRQAPPTLRKSPPSIVPSRSSARLRRQTGRPPETARSLLTSELGAGGVRQARPTPQQRSEVSSEPSSARLLSLRAGVLFQLASFSLGRTRPN